MSDLYGLQAWSCWAALIGLPIATWIIADSFILELDVRPWHPIAAYLFWPVTIMLTLHKTRRWTGIAAFS